MVWADDPEGQLFDNPRDTSNYSSGAVWNSRFDAGTKGKFDTMTARSHFGDLQFFHGMASSDAEAPSTTKANMLNWARFLVKVAKRRHHDHHEAQGRPRGQRACSSPRAS